MLTNENAQQILSNEKLCAIAQELVRVVRQNITIDWNIRESARAKMRTIIKRLLRQHGYPLDSQAREISTLIEQMEHLSKIWAA
ncbi:hypothetical protein KSD_35180 [Ktedonobacter sp. SOSP1-85]|nr:hypothetical protein KSD_35180 [Ktedonobacter sp. SOSP1-85]